MNNTTQLNRSIESSRALLDAVYQNLGYQSGELLNATPSPKPYTDEAEAWLEKGDWLALAEKVKAEKVFFVENDPVIVFCEVPDNEPLHLLETFRRVWCMARPQCLFIASPGELKVYSLNHHPAQGIADWKKIEPLDTIQRIADVSEKLQAYRREQVESRQFFHERNFGKLEQRADKRLIHDLKAVRQSLLNINPKIERYIHALIGRSIFVRYLEDRGILTPEYFENVAKNANQSEWVEILQKADEKDLAPNSEKQRYSRILRNKEFTYAVFNQLADHFNGDIFAHDPKEARTITQEHLDLLRGFLLGDTDTQQQKLFLWAYDFEIVPIELVSSIYEEFYHSPIDKQKNNRDKGTHYTPSVLVEYVLSQLLTPGRLEQKPRLLDFACGSGIFLVQAFRRIVRYRQNELKRPLTANELRQILQEQITGIEINQEAVYVTAFSLSLALLHYQESKDILAQIEHTNGEKPIPRLISNQTQSKNATHYHVLFHANSFSLMDSEREFIKLKLDADPRFPKRVEYKKLYESKETLPFKRNSFDIIVGNPPWGYLKSNEGTPELRTAQEHVFRWCKVFNWLIGDKELSQAFIARASSLLKPDGECGLLVSFGVFLKRHEESQKFRQRWLAESVIKKVVSFTHVRDIFFKAISPFYFVQYKLGKADPTHRVQYWSAKKTELVDKVQSVVLSLADLHQVRQEELAYNEFLWKVYWWGNHRDAALINVLSVEKSLGQLVQERNWDKGQGYKLASDRPYEWLERYKELPIEDFKRYGPIEEKRLRQVPKKVHRLGIRNLYTGWRLLVKRGITQAGRANGRIEARLENKSYCFRNSIHGIRMDNAQDWERKVLVGILWSSVARYYFFMTASSWGTWHHEIHLKHGLMRLPIRFPDNLSLCQRIVEIVDKLRILPIDQQDLLHSESAIKETQNSLERDLDEAIFELYELSESEQDLILDMCGVGLEFFYQKGKSEAVKRVAATKTQGTTNDLPADRNREQGLEGYLYAFLQTWNRELESVGGEFRWHIIRAPHAPMLAVRFTTQLQGEELPSISSDDQQAWPDLLKRLDAASLHPVSHRIYINNMVRAVTDTDIFIIKRDERRLWTRSMAREDAEATLLQAMHLEDKVL